MRSYLRSFSNFNLVFRPVECCWGSWPTNQFPFEDHSAGQNFCHNFNEKISPFFNEKYCEINFNTYVYRLFGAVAMLKIIFMTNLTNSLGVIIPNGGDFIHSWVGVGCDKHWGVMTPQLGGSWQAWVLIVSHCNTWLGCSANISYQGYDAVIKEKCSLRFKSLKHL